MFDASPGGAATSNEESTREGFYAAPEGFRQGANHNKAKPKGKR
jgi:hypothetical protein